MEPAQRQRRTYLFVGFDSTIGLVALLVNCFILVALLRCSAFRKQSFYRYFLLSLVASDIYVCSVNLATLGFVVFAEVKSRSMVYEQKGDSSFILKCTGHIFRTLRLVGFFANLFSLCAMSLNHCLGMILPAAYQQYWKQGRTRLVVVLVWVLSVVLAFLDILLNLFHTSSNGINKGFAVEVDWDQDLIDGIPIDLLYDDEEETKRYSATTATLTTERSPVESVNRMFDILLEEDNQKQQNVAPSASVMCATYSTAKFWYEMCVICLVIVAAALLTICYGIIIRKIIANANSADFQTTIKSIFTTAMLIIAFSTCWMPFVIFEFVMLIQLQPGKAEENLLARSFTIQNVMNTILMTYPLVDAIIYSARLPAVKRFFLFQLTKTCPNLCGRCFNAQESQRCASSDNADAPIRDATNTALLEMAPANASNGPIAVAVRPAHRVVAAQSLDAHHQAQGDDSLTLVTNLGATDSQF